MQAECSVTVNLPLLPLTRADEQHDGCLLSLLSIGSMLQTGIRRHTVSALSCVQQ